MRGRRFATAFAVNLTACLVSFASAAHAAPTVSAGSRRGVAPAGGGLDAVEATVDTEHGSLGLRRCKSGDCSDAGVPTKVIPIPLDRSHLDLANATTTVLKIGDGRSVLLLKVPDAQRKELAFEAVVGGSDEPIFAGLTGYSRGEEGDRSGNVVLVYDRDESTKFVLVADEREDTRICGQTATPLGARGLDPKTMSLRNATLHRLEKAARDGATPVAAKARPSSAKAPLAKILTATGGSSAGAPALTDGKAETVWSEKRSGDGHGEFVTMRSATEVPLHDLVVTIAPPSPAKDGASPRTFFVATDQKLFHVTVPEDAWQKPGASYDVVLPEPLRTSCVAIVLDEAYPRNLTAPEVSIAEVAAVTRFDVEGASLDDVVKELSNPARAEEATALLRRSGDEGLTAVAKHFGSLEGAGRALAVDVAASAGTCEGAAMDLLTSALTDKDSEVRKRALGRIERCGKAAAPSLARAVRAEDEPRRAGSAPLLATIAPSAALDPISEELGKGAPETRRAMRGAFARAAASAPRDKLLEILLREGSSPSSRLDLLRALGPKIADLRPEASAVLAETLRSAPDMATRYLALDPLAHLARSRGATSGELTRLAEMAARDVDWPVRMRALELSADIAPLAPTIVKGTTDAEPRVREAALRAIALGKIVSGAGAAITSLRDDAWTFVRVAAADALGAMPDDASSQAALAQAVDDGSAKVRAAAISALAKTRSSKYEAKIRERLDDGKEDVEVRALAARSLGAMCAKGSADRLTKLALIARSPVDESDERIGTAAIDALAALHPADLEKRLAPLRGKDVRLPLRRAAERALTEPGTCR